MGFVKKTVRRVFGGGHATQAPAAAPAPAVEEPQKVAENDTAKKKKKRGKSSLMVNNGYDNSNGVGSGNTGINL